MLTDITLGQYFPMESVVHRLDPRIKIILLFANIVTIFYFDTPGTYAVLTLFALFVSTLSRMSLMTLFRSIKPLWLIILFTFFIHLIGTPGKVITKLWIWDLTYEGLQQGIFISMRLVLLITMSSILTFTTSPLALTDAIEALLSPFSKIGIPVHELAMMMTIALRFVPTLIEETDKIMKAQQSRGADFSSGNIVTRMYNIIPIIVPLFISSFRRADELAMAMEARCYRGGKGRTKFKTLRIGKKDYFAVGFMAILIAGLGMLKMVEI